VRQSAYRYPDFSDLSPHVARTGAHTSRSSPRASSPTSTVNDLIRNKSKRTVFLSALGWRFTRLGAVSDSSVRCHVGIGFGFGVRSLGSTEDGS